MSVAGASSQHGVVFVLPGQGCHWDGMAVELLDSSAVFAGHIERCEEALRPYVRWSLLDVLRGVPRARRLKRVDVVQPALFAVTVSLAELWRSCGVQPDALVGHSQGEIAAAYLAGGLSLDDAAKVVALRSRALVALSGQGGAAAVALGVDQLDAGVGTVLQRLALAAHNGPRSVVLSGEREALDELLSQCHIGGIKAGRVAIDYASHSPQVEPLRDELLDALSTLAPRSGHTTFFSTLTGGPLDTAGCDAEHWYRAERQTVQFERAVDALLHDGHRTFVEVGPHPVLTSAMQEAADAKPAYEDVLIVGSLRRGQGKPERFLSSLADLRTGGIEVDWDMALRLVGHTSRSASVNRSTPIEGREEEREDEADDSRGGGTRSGDAADRPALIVRIADASRGERMGIVLDAVLAEVAAVVGESALAPAHGRLSFKELGLDSSGVVELRNRLRAITGLRLSATLVFDHPTPATLAGRLYEELIGAQTAGSAAASTILPARAGGSEEPIAVVGMSCRFPGGVNSPEELWELVSTGSDAIGEFPTDRNWDLEALYDPDPDRIGTSYSRHGGFLYDAAEFDAGFFGISPREALAMDPQQRLFLEVSWEALETAGLERRSLKDSMTGVYAGFNTLDYNAVAWLKPEGLEGYNLTGTLGCVIAGRVSYALGLRGPALTVDTACSSSLVALHLACGALREGECSLALAGGANVMVTPGLFVAFSRQRALARDGRCKSFASSADGTSWGEGVGVLLLERLTDAQRNGHQVLCVVRSSAINQDGASNGLTAPNGIAQQEVIRDALLRARLGPAEVDAVEAHGTGTRLGDPVEAQALLATYGQGRAEGHPLRVGSIKSNIGHAQAAAGVAGVIKMAMAMRHGVLPRTLHVEESSREVDWSAGSASLLTEEVPWPRSGVPRRAGVSSYGISGTNAHVILEEAPMPDARMPVDAGDDRPQLYSMPWVLSGKGSDALSAQATRLERFLVANPDLAADDVGLSLACRSAFEHRAVVFGDGIDQRLEGLAALARGVGAPNVADGSVGQNGERLAFLFTGQGAQRVGMGSELHRSFPVFADAFDEVCLHMDEQLGRSLRLTVFGAQASAERDPDREPPGESPLDDTLFTQAGLFALEVALHRLMEAWGLTPDFVIGHSIGEITAAHVAGVFSLEDACRLVATRGRLMSELPPGGAMVAVQASELEIAPTLVGLEDEVALAAVNGPLSVVLSGDEASVLRLSSQWAEMGRKTRRLRVSHAFHSPRMDAMLEEFRRVAEQLSFNEPSIPVVSNVTGEVIGSELCCAEYWTRHVREPVRFADGVRSLRKRGVGMFLELGPDGVLSGMTGDCLAEDQLNAQRDGTSIVALPVMRSGRSEVSTACDALARMWVGGADVDWPATHEGLGAQRVELPTYAFQRQRYWLESSTHEGGHPAALGQLSPDHPLLASAVALADGDSWLFTACLSVRTQPWLADHVVLGTTLLPGTALLELAARAGAVAGCECVRELTLQMPLVLADNGGTQVQVTVGEAEEESGARPLQIHSRGEDSAQDTGPAGERWVCNAVGILAPEAPDASRNRLGEGILATAVWPPPGADPVDVEEIHDRLATSGLEYGPAFQGLGTVWRLDEQLFVEATLPAEHLDQADRFGLHPALFDAALQAIGANISGLGADEAQGKAWLPFSWSEVAFEGKGASALRMHVSPAGRGAVALQISDPNGRPVASVGSLVLRETSTDQLRERGGGRADSLYSLCWVDQDTPQESDEAGPHLVLGAKDGVLASSLRAVEVFADLGSLTDAVDWDENSEFTRTVLVDCTTKRPADVHEPLHQLLALLQNWLADERLMGSRLVVITHGAVSTGTEEDLHDLAGGALWGLVRSAQSECPGRMTLLDIDGESSSWKILDAALTTNEPQLAIRDGKLLGPRLTRATADGALAPPANTLEWRLTPSGTNTLDGMALVAAPDVNRELEPREVRVGVRAAGLNFRDVLIALGAYPGEGIIGSEAAGVVLEVGGEVRDLAPGDRVMGLFTGAFGPLAITDARLIARMPESWSFVQAASMPLVFLTAYYALVDLAKIGRGEKLLVHAATGGVGMAAVQLAHHLGAEVFATASAEKRDFLEQQGLQATRIASSRDPRFREQFLEATAGEGMDVVLNSLARELVDASLDLLPRGGRFVEMGKTDIRDPSVIEADHRGVVYRAFDLMDAGPTRIQQMLSSLIGLFESGALKLSPIRAWDVHRAPGALRFMSQARHIGKIVLTVPTQSMDAAGTVLITGGTGGLGALLARHLVVEHGVRSLLLASRAGESAVGAARLQNELTELGASVRIAGCDVSDRAQLKELIDSIAEDHRLRAVVHAAGVLDDGVIGSMTPGRIDAVLAPKVDAAWHLHELTADMDLDAFVLFSSVAGVLGSPGQGNYAAANAFLDALAVHRRGLGLPALSIAWGPWAQQAGMTGRLDQTDLTRMARSGMLALDPVEGLELFDAARLHGDVAVVPLRVDLGALRAEARAGTTPPLMRGLIRQPSRVLDGDVGQSLSQRLAGVPPDDREQAVLEFVRAETASVLGHSSPHAIDVEVAFKELGFDSLVGVELRNRLILGIGLQLPVTLVFDHASPAAVARYVFEQLQGALAPDSEPVQPNRKASTAAIDEPIAIVGMSCRYPGGAGSPQELWELVAEGRDAIGSFPADRGWDLERLYDPDPDRLGATYVQQGGFLYDAGKFDAGFFGIGPKEAIAMDPQQRLLLEGSWEAFEHAGLDPTSLRGSDTGVFMGVMYHDYGTRLADSAPEGMEVYLGTGSAGSIASGRTAYIFGLEGPAVTIDTACSSSLVALHWACQALRSGECATALAGGVTVLSTPTVFVEFARQRALAPDGRCKSFAGAADGTAWGEGVAVLMLERLSDAHRNGRRVLALVRGSAINQDGASNGLTAPNGPSQQRVIQQALANADLSPGQIDAVEAHGTGTTLGDPIEAQALLATYGRARSPDHPLWLGSVKSNIGHTQAAAGLAGVIKMVMAMRHGILPRTLHVDEPSGKVDWSSNAISLLSQPAPWERNGEPRRAGISSFGISGTNAHVILEEAPDREPLSHSGQPAPDGQVDLELVPWVISAKSTRALRAQADRLRSRAKAGQNLSHLDLGLSLASTRTVFPTRAVLLGRDREALMSALEKLCDGTPCASVIDRAEDGHTGALALLFTGQGAQRVGMGRELYEKFPVFRDALDETCGYLDGPLGRSIRDVMFGAHESQSARVDGEQASHISPEEGPLGETAFTQTCLFALEVALFRLLESWGVRPDYLIGHSVGELAAAHVAGVLSLQDACALVAARGRLMGALPVGGAMVAVQASESEMLESIPAASENIALAAVNGPDSVVISGEEDAVLELAATWSKRGRKTRRLRVSHAFHSNRMDGMLSQFAEIAERLSYAQPRIPIVSNLTGSVMAPGELCSARYWVRHVRETVRFADGVRWLVDRGVGAFLELGPDGVLSAMVQECLGDTALAHSAADSPVDSADLGEPTGMPNGVAASPVLRAGEGEVETLLTALAGVWVAGVDVDWARLFDRSGAQQVELPTYAFQREWLWLDSVERGTPGAQTVGQTSANHPLLGAAVALADEKGRLFTGRLSLRTHPWLADHVVLGKTLLPGTAFLELALHAGRQLGCEVVKELTLQSPLPLPEDGAVHLQVEVGQAEDDGTRSLSIHSRIEQASGDWPGGEAEWVCHAVGSLGSNGPPVAETAEDHAWPPVGAESVSVEHLYDQLAEDGLQYGPVFQGLARAWRRGPEIFADVALPDVELDQAGSFGLHPALLDAALHAVAFAAPPDAVERPGTVRLPFCWNDVVLLEGGASALRVRFSPTAGDSVEIAVANRNGRPLASVGSLTMRGASTTEISGATQSTDGLFHLDWMGTPVDPARAVASRGSHLALVGVGNMASDPGIVHQLRSSVGSVQSYADLSLLGEAIELGRVDAPDFALLDCTSLGGDLPGSAHAGVEWVLDAVRQWLEDERLGNARLAILTRNAVATSAGEDVLDLAGAAVWGLVRSAQSEHPRRFVLVDLDGESSSLQALAAALAQDEPQIAIRKGEQAVPRLVRPSSNGELTAPAGAPAWRLDAGAANTFDGLALVACPEANRTLEPEEIRVEVRAAGVNFKDVLIALGMYPGEATIGNEAAGVILEVGSDVQDLAPGDRVTGLFSGAFGPLAITDARLVARMPGDWSFAQAAAMPLVFLTAYYALVDLANMRPRERLLVHSAAGGVGMAVVQLAQHLDVEVFGTASMEKRSVLEECGLPATHIAGSRDLDFREQFLEETEGAGVDVVLNSLTGEFVDASFELLARGGHFLEMGKTDIRNPAELPGGCDGVLYRAFDLMDAGPVRINEMLAIVMGLFEQGALRLPPIRVWDVQRAPEALRFMSQARHVGKIVLTLPARELDSHGTVLITGGTGGLGRLLARHLVVDRGVRHLLLVSRSGDTAAGAPQLMEELTECGANVRIASCDVSDRQQLEALIASVSEDHPLRGVVHAAGVLDDGLIDSLTTERLERVFAPKLDAAWYLHELTAHMDLDAFVLFSSVAGTLGGPGQGNYAAASSFLDGLAVHRRALGMPAVAMAWGPWEAAGMTSGLDRADLARMSRSGMLALSSEQGLELFDTACMSSRAQTLLARVDISALRASNAETRSSGVLGSLMPATVSRDGMAKVDSSSLAARFAGAAVAERARVVTEFVRAQAVAVLGHTSPEAIDSGMTFKELGFDSLAAVELRNRLGASSGLRLVATLVFDYPTLGALAGHLCDRMSAAAAKPERSTQVDLDGLALALSSMSAEEARRTGAVARLRNILSRWGDAEATIDRDVVDDDLSLVADEEIFELIDREFGVS